jgi:hypothetical protein
MNVEVMIIQNARNPCNAIRSQIIRQGWADLRTNFLAYATDNLFEHAFTNIRLDLLGSEKCAERWMDSMHALAILTPCVKQFPWILPIS